MELSLVPVTCSPGVGARASSWCAGGVATWIWDCGGQRCTVSSSDAHDSGKKARRVES